MMNTLKGKIINAMRPRITLQVQDLEMTSGSRHASTPELQIQGKLIFQQNNLFFQEDGTQGAQQILKNDEVYTKILDQLTQKGGRHTMTRRHKRKRTKKTRKH